MNLDRNVLTLDEYRFMEQRDFPAATGEFSSLLRDIAFAAKLINAEVIKAGLVDILGETGTVNVQGERVNILLHTILWMAAVILIMEYPSEPSLVFTCEKLLPGKLLQKKTFGLKERI